MDQKSTIKDIAKAAGVSIVTVHRAIYGKPGVSETVRKEIVRLADEMGYCPNALSSVLRRKPVRIVVAFPELTRDNRYFYSELWEGYREYKEDLKAYHLEFIELPYCDTEEDGFVAKIKNVFRQYNGEIDGVLTGGRIYKDGYDAIRRIIEDKIPVVIVSEDASECQPLCCVQSDCFINGMLAAEVLTSQISKDGKILMCAGDMLLKSNWDSMLGFESYLRENCCVNSLFKLHGYEGVDGLYESVVKALTTDTRIEGLYSVNLRCSLMLARIVEELRLQGKIKLVGSDLCSESINYMNRGIITNIIFKNPRYLGKTGAKRLTDFILHGKNPPSKNEYNKSVVIFKSNLEQYL